MKTTSTGRAGALLTAALTLPISSLLQAGTTIDAANHYAWGANVGWMDGRGDVNNGAVIGEYVCAGYVYAANVGWISLGSGSPANGIQYENNSASDYGVNHDDLGNLRGYAYGANIGWIRFETNGAPRVDLLTGNFTGYAWSANCGWISLSNASAFVQTDTIAPGIDSDADGLADAWELTWFGNLTKATASSDYDGDGMTDAQEYQADTDPLDSKDKLWITSYARDGTYNDLWWTSKPTRCYAVQGELSLGAETDWVDYVVLPSPGANNVGFDRTSSQEFYRVRAFRPLMP